MHQPVYHSQTWKNTEVDCTDEYKPVKLTCVFLAKVWSYVMGFQSSVKINIVIGGA